MYRIQAAFCLLPAALLLVVLVFGGCAEEKGPLEIIGDYIDEYSGDHQITALTWISFAGESVIHIIGYSNDLDYLLGQNDDEFSYNPGKYSRQDWAFHNGNLYYCSTVFNADSLAEAEAGQADRTDPASGGCDATSNFPWTNLTP